SKRDSCRERCDHMLHCSTSAADLETRIARPWRRFKAGARRQPGRFPNRREAGGRIFYPFFYPSGSTWLDRTRAKRRRKDAFRLAPPRLTDLQNRGLQVRVLSPL